MARENARPSKKNWARKKRMASWARQRQRGRGRRRPGSHGGGWSRRAEPALHPAAQRAEEARALQGGEHRLTKLGKGFFRDKYYEYLAHAPVIIRGRRCSGRNAGAGYERRDWLPVNELGGAMTRHPAHLTEEQVAQRVKQQVEASLAGGPMLQLLDETYFLSTQSTQYRNSRTEVETLLRQRMRGLRSVSFQLPCEEDVLQSAFEDKPLCVPRQLAELLQLSVEAGGASASPPRRCESSACGATRPCAC